MDPSLKSAYGSYEVPEIINFLLELNKKYISKNFDMSLIGFRIIDSYNPYSITPPDLIPFADTGGNGIHFGFLTDFGSVNSLKFAPIVCVTPTDDPPIRLIARNITDFLDLVVSVPHVEILESWWSCKNEEEKLQEQFLFDSEYPQWIKQFRDEIFEYLKSEFGAKPRNVLPYLKETLRIREKECALTTLDGLGVRGCRGNVLSERYQFNDKRIEDGDELARMRAYISNTASMEAKLAFIRDANYWYVIERDHPTPVSNFLREIIISLDLKDEVKRMFDIHV